MVRRGFGAEMQVDRDAWELELRAGEVRDVWIFYYYGQRSRMQDGPAGSPAGPFR